MSYAAEMLIGGRGPAWSALDGRLLAPSGVAPQYPAYFTGLSGVTFPVRPPWQVAGVDYGVGYPSGQVFKNPLVDTLPTGATADTLNKLIRCNSTNGLTFDGWDFSVSGGYTLYVNGTTANTTVTNCKFTVGANAKTPIQSDAGAGNLTVTYCIIDGAGINTGFEMIRPGDNASLVVQYCWLKNAYSDSINTHNGAHDIRFNLFDSIMWVDGAHSDHIQGFDGCASFALQFNTVYQPAGNVSTGLPGFCNAFIFYQDVSDDTVVSLLDIGYNSIVGVGSTGHLTEDSDKTGAAFGYPISLGGNGGAVGLMDRAQVHDNYIARTAAAPEMFGFSYPKAQATTTNFLRNINLTTGAEFTTNP